MIFFISLLSRRLNIFWGVFIGFRRWKAPIPYLSFGYYLLVRVCFILIYFGVLHVWDYWSTWFSWFWYSDKSFHVGYIFNPSLKTVGWQSFSKNCLIVSLRIKDLTTICLSVCVISIVFVDTVCLFIIELIYLFQKIK